MLRTRGLLRSGVASRRCFSSQPDHWSGIDPEYLSWRGLNIVLRVLNGIPDFVNYSRAQPRIFALGTSEEVRNSMYVLSQFPTATRVRLPEFVQGAERAAHTVLQRLYSHEIAETKDFLEQLATPESLKALLRKPSAPLEGEKKAGNVVLEQLNVNSAVLSAVEYTSETVDEAVVREWLAFRVQYDVTEHLLVSPEGEQGIEDRRAVNTSFMWTFEADVTKPEEFEWAIVAATPFKEEAAVLKTKEAQDSDDSKETNE